MVPMILNDKCSAAVRFAFLEAPMADSSAVIQDQRHGDVEGDDARGADRLEDAH